jgi:hypothetical protein
MRVYFELDLPESYLANGTIVTQYFEFVDSTVDLTTDTYKSFTCVTEVGNVNETYVENSNGTSTFATNE